VFTCDSEEDASSSVSSTLSASTASSTDLRSLYVGLTMFGKVVSAGVSGVSLPLAALDGGWNTSTEYLQTPTCHTIICYAMAVHTVYKRDSKDKHTETQNPKKQCQQTSSVYNT